MRKELNTFMLQLPTYDILEQKISIGAIADIAKTKREKQIVLVGEKWMQFLLLQLKFQETSRHPAFMGNCQILSLVNLCFYLFVSGVNQVE